MAKENTSRIVSLGQNNHGVVAITDTVVAVIAGYAATEVEGVATMAGNITSSLMSRVGVNILSKGVRIQIANGTVNADLAIMVKYGYDIPATTQQVQKKVASAIETMTGLNVANVNIRVAGAVIS